MRDTDAIAAARAPRIPTWQLTELVGWGLERRPEAERRNYPHIFVSEIHRGATRISNQIELYPSVAKFIAKLCRDDGRAFCLLSRGEDGSWDIADYGYCLGDTIEVRP